MKEQIDFRQTGRLPDWADAQVKIARLINISAPPPPPPPKASEICLRTKGTKGTMRPQASE